ncbi:MAG: alpha/beta hydrolase [Microcella sp.]|uniref:alpha/beta fold hydrolase n=1 Tax=Microcella sp. TaxID=1913979 RepID=UPI0024CDABB6|nr:alpha/beta hydrolase [Microcella sp.]UYN83987.1 MAG: alpha/beta hydrolase [Microcella sp.]
MTDHLLAGIHAHDVSTPRLRARVLERPAQSEPSTTVVFVHGNVSSSQFYQPTMLALAPDVRALAIDLRGFGGSETLPVDASRGLRDFSDDVLSVLDALELDRVHLVGWSMGGGVVMQLMLDAAERIASVTLESPVSPYGFGGTARDGSLLTPDAAGTGGGGANPDFVARLDAGDTSADEATSPRSVYRSAYVAAPDELDHEDLWVASMLTTATGVGNYPGDSTASENWPGFAPGSNGVLNTMAPTNFNASAIVDLEHKPAVLWIRGSADAIVSDGSFFDLNMLGQVGVIPGWPGADVAPPQPMVTQTRDVLERYVAHGGASRELVFEGCGHSPHLEREREFVEALSEHLESNR